MQADLATPRLCEASIEQPGHTTQAAIVLEPGIDARAELALKLEPLLAAKAKAKLATHTKRGCQNSDKAEHTFPELAKVAGLPTTSQAIGG